MNETWVRIHRLVIIGDGKVYRYKGRYYDFGGYKKDFFAVFDDIDEIYIFNRICDIDEVQVGMQEIKCPKDKRLSFVGTENQSEGYRGYVFSLSHVLRKMKVLFAEPAVVMGNMIDVFMWIFWLFCRKKSQIYISRYPGDPEIFEHNGKPLGKMFAIIAKRLTRHFHEKCALQTFVSKGLMDRYAVRKIPSVVWNDFLMTEKDIVNDVYISKTEEFNILFVGRLSREKGLTNLIDAIETINNEAIHLTIIGDGEMKGLIQRLIREKKCEMQIDLIGWVPHGDRLFHYMKKSDVLVLPSFSEGLGLVLLEAMANGTTVIGSRVGGIPEIVKDGINGLLFEAGNTTDLVRKISLLYQDRDLLEKLSRNGIETAQKNVREMQIKRFHRAYMKYVYPKIRCISE